MLDKYLKLAISFQYSYVLAYFSNLLYSFDYFYFSFFYFTINEKQSISHTKRKHYMPEEDRTDKSP